MAKVLSIKHSQRLRMEVFIVKRIRKAMSRMKNLRSIVFVA